MLDRVLRAWKDRLLAPIARMLGSSLPPNVVSLVGLIAGLGSAAAVLGHQWGWALTLWLVNRTLDGLDGALARMYRRETPFGGYVDIVADYLVYAAIPAAIVVADGTWRLAVGGLALLAAFYVNTASWLYLAALLEQRHDGARARGEATSITMPPGLIAGAETVVFYALFLALPSRQLLLFVVMAMMVAVNVVIRLAWAWRHLRP
jgi:phosphatidylglycerophosphate synthase